MKNGDWKINRSPTTLPAGRKAYYQKVKARVHEALGNKCRCGHDDPRVLQIDHVYGDGAEDRESRSGTSFLLFVLKNIHSGRYQLLCANCNWLKRHTNDEVPKIYADDHAFPTEEAHVRTWPMRTCKCGTSFAPRSGCHRRCVQSCKTNSQSILTNEGE